MDKSSADEIVPIEPNDILYGEPEPDVDSEFDDETPIEPQDIEQADAEEVPEEPEFEVDSEFEIDADIDTGAIDSKLDAPVFNRIVTLRDSWAKIEKAQLDNS